MQRLFTLLFCCSLCFSLSLSAQDAKNVYENMFCPIYEFDEYIMIGEWENIDEQEAILGAIAYMTFYRGDSTIAYQMYKEVGTIEPGETVEVRIGYIDWTQVLDAADIAWSEMKLETLNDINPGNDGVIKACSIVPDASGVTMADVRAAIETLMEGRNQQELADVYLTQAPSFPGTAVHVQGNPVVDFETTKRSWLGWIHWNATLGFPSQTSLIEFDMQTMELQEFASNSWPSIDGDLFLWDDPNRLIIVGDLPVEEISSEFPDLEEPQPSGKDSVCAIVVGGYDVNKSSNTDVKQFAWSLSKNPYGPRLKDSQIIVLNDVYTDSLKGVIADAKGRCNKLYFYFSGIGHAGSGMYVSDDDLSNRIYITYRELIFELLSTNVKNICITLDCGNAGAFIDSLKLFPEYKDRNIDVITATKANKPNSYRMFQLGSEQFYANEFTWNYNQCGSDTAADANGDGIIDRKEIYAWISYVDPKTATGKRLSEVTGFTMFSSSAVEKVSGPDSKTVKNDATGVTIQGVPSNSGDMTVRSSVNTSSNNEEGYSGGQGVVEVLKNLVWGVEISGAADFVDVLLLTNPFLDGLISQVVTLGAVYYEENSDTWLAFPEQSFDEETGVVTINNVPDGNYTIRLAYIESIVDVPKSDIVLKTYPNPSTDHVTVVAPFTGHCEVQVVSVEGRVVFETAKHVNPGDVVSFATTSLAPGHYYIVISGGTVTAKSQFLKL